MRKISVVTVCLNAAQEIERTIESVLKQSYTDFEYIIKDGESSDGIENIIAKYRNAFQEKNIELKFKRQKDAGIYDAMNQAAHICSGEWIIYANAGDLFFNKDVLKEIVQVQQQNSGVLYGMTKVIINSKWSMITEAVFQRNRIDFCHQSILVRRELMLKYPFDNQYKIAADRDFLLKLQKNGIKFQNVNMIISTFYNNGISATNYTVLYKEIDEINKKYDIKQKPNRPFISKMKTKCTQIIPIVADISFVFKKLKKYKENS